MGLDKILSKIQNQIKEASATMELFVDANVQPSVSDCEKLQKQLFLLEELVAVYKYRKEEKELSPSFTLHAKINEVVVEKELVKKELSEQVHSSDASLKETSDNKKTEIRDEETVVFTRPSEEKKSENIQPLVIGINDKFRFINELFKQNNSEYNIALEQLSAVQSWHDAEVYLNSLKNLYDWQDDSEVVKYFYSIVKKRF